MHSAQAVREAMGEQARAHLIEMDALRAELRASVDLMRILTSSVLDFKYLRAQNRAAAFIAAYDAQHPEGK